ncbi:3-phosphoserine/phosphohydroxythreonine transaminase [Brumimicrobium glaciale]|uniref:Phosphoserine aminotransferase n=1 Tax=Brumimicrobium glaciale TaxID=200475 RepID=A0A4Q4KK14_9FLAO|nr:3-phosphoserine/phosphohydroxythreonine transaminase [Brumimicrobium glaciale]RYM32149.1 3-phosphoserine/phosphohydroxythreonine transaminase [Brumimicrobium glaciale]
MKHNFGAGPCILPQEVFKEAAAAVLDFNGLSILEVSHRSADFVKVMEEARENVKKALNVPEGYTVLFLQGGASLGFLIAAYNLAGEHKRGAYINTGTWATNAIKEGVNAGLEAVSIASSEDKGFNYIPEFDEIPEDIDFLHYTSNNTIVGTQFKSIPETNVPLICDMSSDIFSQPIDVSKFDLIYAGAQKNLGPAGATLYIVKDSILGKSSLNIPSYLDLAIHAKKDSMFNTPPVFSVFVSNLNLKHMLKNGGVEEMGRKNKAKADLLYGEIDSNPNFEGTTEVKDRSLMNVTFRLTDDSKKERFDKLWNDGNIIGLKGHRSVGGYRASMYNALELKSVQALVDIMKSL